MDPKGSPSRRISSGKRPTGRPQIRYKDVCKKDLKAVDIDINGWETLTSERSDKKQVFRPSEPEETLSEWAEAKRQTRKARNQGDRPATDHTRRSSRTTNQSAIP